MLSSNGAIWACRKGRGSRSICLRSQLLAARTQEFWFETYDTNLGQGGQDFDVTLLVDVAVTSAAEVLGTV
jgi:hypothetical protein